MRDAKPLEDEAGRQKIADEQVLLILATSRLLDSVEHVRVHHDRLLGLLNARGWLPTEEPDRCD